VSRRVEDLNRRLLRDRDAMDRAYAEPLDIRAVAAVAHVSEAHLIRTFRSVSWHPGMQGLHMAVASRDLELLRPGC
jgi:AraC-like DNA-binding protein